MAQCHNSSDIDLDNIAPGSDPQPLGRRESSDSVVSLPAVTGSDNKPVVPQDVETGVSPHPSDFIHQEAFLRLLERKGILTWTQCRAIKNQGVQSKQVALLKTILSQKDSAAYLKFCDALFDYQHSQHGHSEAERSAALTGTGPTRTTVEHKIPTIPVLDINEPPSSSGTRFPKLPNKSALTGPTPSVRKPAPSYQQHPSATVQAGGQQQPSATVQVGGQTHEWRRSRDVERLSQENDKLLGVIQETVSKLESDRLITLFQQMISKLEQEKDEQKEKIGSLENKLRDSQEFNGRLENAIAGMNRFRPLSGTLLSPSKDSLALANMQEQCKVKDERITELEGQLTECKDKMQGMIRVMIGLHDRVGGANGGGRRQRVDSSSSAASSDSSVDLLGHFVEGFMQGLLGEGRREPGLAALMRGPLDSSSSDDDSSSDGESICIRANPNPRSPFTPQARADPYRARQPANNNGQSTETKEETKENNNEGEQEDSEDKSDNEQTKGVSSNSSPAPPRSPDTPQAPAAAAAPTQQLNRSLVPMGQGPPSGLPFGGGNPGLTGGLASILGLFAQPNPTAAPSNEFMQIYQLVMTKLPQIMTLSTRATERGSLFQKVKNKVAALRKRVLELEGEEFKNPDDETIQTWMTEAREELSREQDGLTEAAGKMTDTVDGLLKLMAEIIATTLPNIAPAVPAGRDPQCPIS